MRLILRILGTWLVGLAVVLIIIDGTKSLGADQVVMTSFGDVWLSLHAQSLAATETFFQSRFFADLLAGVFAGITAYPAFAVVGVPGLLLALLGRKPRRERYLRADQI